jgi:hypothetical protein
MKVSGAYIYTFSISDAHARTSPDASSVPTQSGNATFTTVITACLFCTLFIDRMNDDNRAIDQTEKEQ